MATTKLVRVPAPFTGGLKDKPEGPRDAAVLEDALMPLGIACERGGFAATGQAVASSLCRDVWEDVIGAGVALGTEAVSDLMFAGTTTVTIATSVARAQNLYLFPDWDCDANDQGFRIMRGTFNGEVLIFPLDGLSPVMCFAGHLTRTTATAKNLTTTKGSTITTAGAGTFASTDVGAYLHIGPAHGCRRIVGYVSDTTIVVDVPWDFTLAAEEGAIMPMGLLNLFAKVASSGKASKNGTATTVNGSSTSWDSFPQGEVAVHAAGAIRGYTDYIEPLGVDYGTPLPVKAVAGGGSPITVGGTTPPDWSGATAIDYIIGRHIPARMGVVHRDTLYLAGYRPYPGRLFIAPPAWDGRTPKNGEFSYEVEIGRAMMMAFQDVPDPFTTHEITGLLSLPSGNLGILCSDATYVGYGAYPALRIDRTSDRGNLKPESCLTAERGAWMAGPEGVFEFQGQNSPRLISGDIDGTWTRLADGVDNIALGYFNGMLLCTIGTAAAAPTYVWDIRNRVWSGPWSLGAVYAYCYSNRRAATGHAFGVDPFGGTPRLLAGRGGTQAYDVSSTVVDHTQDIAVTTNRGAFRARTPFDVTGDISVEREVKMAKVQYELTGTGTPQLTMTPGPNGVNPAKQLVATSGDGPDSDLAFPTTDLSGSESTLGTRQHRFDLELEHTQGVATRVAVHELEFEVKEYRHRG